MVPLLLAAALALASQTQVSGGAADSNRRPARRRGSVFGVAWRLTIDRRRQRT